MYVTLLEGGLLLLLVVSLHFSHPLFDIPLQVHVMYVVKHDCRSSGHSRRCFIVCSAS